MGSLKELADQTEVVAKAVELATSSNVILSEVISIERSLASWQKKVNNYMDDLEDPDLAGEIRAAIRKAYNDSQIMVSRLEGERTMLAVKMVDVEKARQGAKKIMQWCRHC